YNFPNDELAEARFPEELENVTIFHYLRTDRFDRQQIFASAEGYREFLGIDLAGSNKVFRSRVAELIGGEYPFAISSTRIPVHARAVSAADALSKTAYEAALSQWRDETTSRIKKLDEEIRLAAALGNDAATIK